MDLFAAYYEHEYGTDMRVFKRIQSAEKWRQEIASEWWDHEFPDDEMPNDPEEAAEMYFQMMGDRCGPAEFFHIQKCKVEE